MSENSWLYDKSFYKKMSDNEKYMELLVHKLIKFIKYCPIPILTSLKEDHIVFSLGEIKKYLVLDSNVSVFDDISILNKFFYPHYPSFSVDREGVEIPCSPEEIAVIMNRENISAEEALEFKVTGKVKENVVIDRIWLLKDQFRTENYYNNDITSKKHKLYVSKVPLSSFLRNLRSMKKEGEDSIAIKDYVEKNSRFIIEQKIQPHRLSFTGDLLFNSIRIQQSLNPDTRFIQVDDSKFRFGNIIYSADFDEICPILDSLSIHLEVL